MKVIAITKCCECESVRDKLIVVAYPTGLIYVCRHCVEDFWPHLLRDGQP